MVVKLEKQVESKLIYELEWFKFTVDDVIIGDEQKATRIVVDHPGAASILAVTQDDKVILVSQFRYPTNEVLYEIPAGKLDSWGGDFYDTALREFAEETPFTAERMELLYGFYTCPGFSNEFIHLYKAHGISQNNEYNLDDDEYVEIHYFTKKEVKNLLETSEIRDAKTIIALQYWLNE